LSISPNHQTRRGNNAVGFSPAQSTQMMLPSHEAARD
jgi:hypothetical protein